MARKQVLFHYVKPAVVIVLLFAAFYAIHSLLNFLKGILEIPDYFRWSFLPLFMFSLPIILLLGNVILFLIKPLRKYFSRSESFIVATKQLLYSILLFLPLLVLSILVIYFSYIEYEEIFVSILSIFGSIILGTISLLLTCTKFKKS